MIPLYCVDRSRSRSRFRWRLQRESARSTEKIVPANLDLRSGILYGEFRSEGEHAYFLCIRLKDWQQRYLGLNSEALGI